MTKKFLKTWGVGPGSDTMRSEVQGLLDGGAKIGRDGRTVHVGPCFAVVLGSPGIAVKFASALNKTRRPLHLIKQDLDADWARRVKVRDNNTCALCGVQGDKIGKSGKKDVLTAHHWLKTKQQARMARWARPCGVTVHYSEHIHALHENPCWVDMCTIYESVTKNEGISEAGLIPTVMLMKVEITEARARHLWYETIFAIPTPAIG